MKIFKSFSLICLTLVFVVGTIPVGFCDDIEDHFLLPELQTSQVIFIDVKDVPLVNVLKIISQQTGLSFVAADDVADKKVTLYIINSMPTLLLILGCFFTIFYGYSVGSINLFGPASSYRCR